MKESFIKFLGEHPEQRFWQALRNWTRENIDADCNYILLAPAHFEESEEKVALASLKDTFYYEDNRIRKG
jgi:uncharacterized protein YrzB (UPF0473 family)